MSIRIFVTTDNHVGYNETDPVQGDDAAASFDEAMTIAQRADVDFVVQGGDLFHVNKPTKRSLYSVMRTLRRTCLGDKPVEFEVLNFDALALPDAQDFDYPNFEDANLNVALPVFAISGNHDDAGGAVGSNMLSPLDVLSMAGLLNHFGRVFDSADIVVKPVLIEKAGVRVALYGLASVRDERLYRTFRENRVKFLRPSHDPESWYNILVVHQNHVAHGPTNFLPHEFLPNFVDLVIWGHEHECRIDPEADPNKGFLVMQPGSTVATSLSESETRPKHVAVISIGTNKQFSYEKIALKSVRPFAMRTVSLHEHANINPGDRDARAKVTEWLTAQVEELIDEAKEAWIQQHADDAGAVLDDAQVPLPLVRLRVDYTGYEVENTTRFSNRFVGQVANTTNVLSLIRRRETGAKLGPKLSSDGVPEGRVVNNVRQVRELLHQYLTAETLDVLPEREMVEALYKFVEKDEKLALKTGVDGIVKDRVAQLMTSVDGLTLQNPPQPSYAARPSASPHSSSPSPPSRIESSVDEPVRPTRIAHRAAPQRRREPVPAPEPEPEPAPESAPEPDVVVRETPEPEPESEPESEPEPEAMIPDSEEELHEERQAAARQPRPRQGEKTAPRAKAPPRAKRATRPAFEVQPSPPPHEFDAEDDSDEMFSSQDL